MEKDAALLLSSRRRNPTLQSKIRGTAHRHALHTCILGMPSIFSTVIMTLHDHLSHVQLTKAVIHRRVVHIHMMHTVDTKRMEPILQVSGDTCVVGRAVLRVSYCACARPSFDAIAVAERRPPVYNCEQLSANFTFSVYIRLDFIASCVQSPQRYLDGKGYCQIEDKKHIAEFPPTRL